MSVGRFGESIMYQINMGAKVEQLEDVRIYRSVALYVNGNFLKDPEEK